MMNRSGIFKKTLSSLPLFLLFAGCWLLAAVFMSGCGTQGAQAPQAQAAGKKIIIWHWMTDREEAFQELAKRYEAKTGVKVVLELYAPSDAYSQKVRAAAQARALPDIYGLLGEKRDFAAFIKAGHVANLTGAMEAQGAAWKNLLYEKALAVNEFKADNPYGVEPGIYGVPIDVMNIQMVYNKKLFQKAGLDPERPPKDWAEFVADCQKLKEAGIQGLVSGWGEIWMIDCLASNFAFNIMGPEKVLATIRGEVPYTDPDWVKVFSLFKEMADRGMLASGIVTMVNKSAEQNFANERSAFAFNGSWCVNVYHGMNPSLEYGVMLPPKVNLKNPMYIWGGAGSSLLVNDRSLVKEEAIAFLKWLTATEQQAYLSETTRNLPSNRKVSGSIPAILADFSKGMDNVTHPNIWPVNELPKVIERFDKGIQSIIIGEKTPEGLAEELAKLKAEEMAKKGNQ
ncbi:MAG: extracellular solute-binding protein [Candidatus Omnitrophica bacterium]|nr:extracellular solute-binding protein [Candidatus Omnitrophota bacterium]